MFDIIKDLFKKQKLRKNYVEEPTIYRPAIVVGHSPSKQGAVSYTNESEFNFNMSIANKAVMQLKPHGIHCPIIHREEVHKNPRKKVAERLATLRVNFVMELHFNSFQKTAYGCEMLLLDSHEKHSLMWNFLDIWTDELAKEFELRERGDDGVVHLSKGNRGYSNLKYYQDYGIEYGTIIEPMFANTYNRESARFFEGNGRNKYAAFLAKMLIDAKNLVLKK